MSVLNDQHANNLSLTLHGLTIKRTSFFNQFNILRPSCPGLPVPWRQTTWPYQSVKTPVRLNTSGSEQLLMLLAVSVCSCQYLDRRVSRLFQMIRSVSSTGLYCASSYLGWLSTSFLWRYVFTVSCRQFIHQTVPRALPRLARLFTSPPCFPMWSSLSSSSVVLLWREQPQDCPTCLRLR